MSDDMQPRRAETAPFVRRIRMHRILYTTGLVLALGILFLLVWKLCRNTFFACLCLILGGLALYSFYARVMLANEASITPILTRDLDPELFSAVFRQTLKGSRHFPSLQRMMEVTERFYLGDYDFVVRTVRHDRTLWQWTQPEFICYYVQSACAMGLSEEAEEGLSLFLQAKMQKEYSDPAVASMIDRYEHLSLAALCLVTDAPAEALTHAANVYEDVQSPALCALYACGYLATACALTGDKKRAQELRAHVLAHSPAFGIVKHLSPKGK